MKEGKVYGTTKLIKSSLGVVGQVVRKELSEKVTSELKSER